MFKMRIKPLSLKGLKLITPRLFLDERGSFLESYRKPLYEQAGIEEEFVQDNYSFSKRGTIRGMHFQTHPGQAKLVFVVEGEIYDVAVDIRPYSPTFGKWEGLLLNSTTCEQLYIPVGFAHGFCALSEKARVLYKVSSTYNPDTEKTFRYDDPAVAIDWPLKEPILSARDLNSPLFHEVFI